MPLAFAPTGFTRLFHHEGERAVARVAERVGIPTGLSTVGTVTPEDLAAQAPTASKWFQLYMWPDRGASAELIGRAQAAGFHVLAFTVDVRWPAAPARRPQRPRLPAAPDAAHAGRHRAISVVGHVC
jgi:L-lactate dehydrogenase (cytochrome)